MAKPKNPLLSLGARGTIADSLTFQKRGQDTIAREKPIPENPRSEAQLAQRQVYRDAVDAWHALTAEEKEAWRGVCPGLSPYHCFMRSELKYVPPPLPIDIGAAAIDRDSGTGGLYTYINKENPANGSGIITTVEIWAYINLTNCVVGTFYTTNGNTLKCRDSVAIGAVQAGAKRAFSGLSLAVETGDYIGCYFTEGTIDNDTSGYAGAWFVSGEYIDPGDEATFSFMDGIAISLYGIGETQP